MRFEWWPQRDTIELAESPTPWDRSSPAPPSAGIGLWGGQRPSLVGYVTVTGAHGRGDRRRRVLKLPTLNAVSWPAASS